MPNEVFHIIKDPVHGSMQFTTEEDNWVKPFINSENFQRLRYVKQLGLTDWIFPGAVHTRFNHGLGCCYIASQIANKLELQAEDRQIVVLAGLLHDIGHGPFSHAFEDIFCKHSIRHEMWTAMFLQEYAKPEFLKAFNELNKNTPLNEEKIDIIQKLIMSNQCQNKLLADIVSSQLDADRLDYLLRDSHFCGVTYGVYDFRWLLNCLTAIKKDGSVRLGITHKGIGVVEQYLMARRLMIRNVYQNGKKYGAEFLLREFLKCLAQDTQLAQLGSNTLVCFLREVNEFNVRAKQTTELQKLTEQFIKKNYHLYKQLCDYDVFSIIRYLSGLKDKHPAVKLAKRLQIRALPKILYVDEKNAKMASKLVAEFKEEFGGKICAWQIAILNLPHLSYEVNNDPILIKDHYGSVKYLHDNSLMINAMSDKYENACLVSIDVGIIEWPQITKLIKKLCEL
jgi:uncharacterized protein